MYICVKLQLKANIEVDSRLHKAMFKNIFHDLPIRLWFIPPSVQVHQLGRLSSNDKAVIPLTPQI